MSVQDIGGLLTSYPRRRPPLPEAHRRIYAAEYKVNRDRQTFVHKLSEKAEAWMHRQVARPGKPGSILEIGAGTLNHLPFETAQTYDVVEPFNALYHDSPHRNRIRRFYRDVTEVPPENAYDRVISVAVLEHLEALPVIVACGGMLLAPGGLFQAGIPSEGAFLWGVGWRCTTGISYRLRTGLSFATLMRHEHVNDADEIIAIVRHYFQDVEVSRFPTPAHHLSLYAYVHAARPRVDACRAYLRSQGIAR